MASNGHSGPPDCTLIPSDGKMDPTMGFSRSETFVTSILVEKVMYIAWKLLPMARNNIMAPLRSGA